MKPPNADAAQIAPEKIEGYLLPESHPVGRSKARFFRSLGFRREEAGALRLELLRIAGEGEASLVQTQFGSKYLVDGVLVGRLRSANVRTVWILEGERPRFVTAYPV